MANLHVFPPVFYKIMSLGRWARQKGEFKGFKHGCPDFSESCMSKIIAKTNS